MPRRFLSPTRVAEERGSSDDEPLDSRGRQAAVHKLVDDLASASETENENEDPGHDGTHESGTPSTPDDHFNAVGKVELSSDDEGDLNKQIEQRNQNPKRKKPAPRGRRPKKQKLDDSNPARKKRKPAVYGDASDAEDEEAALDAEVPDYLRKRKDLFERNREKFDVAGLKIPPTYEDVDFSDDENIESLKEKPDFKSIRPPQKYEDRMLPYSLGVIPAPIAQWLREYQVEGAAFLHELFVYQKGGILGDDMGLGKTIQVIAALTAAFGKTGDERDRKRMRKMRRAGKKLWYPKVLIVCPGTLMENWKSEFDRWGWWHVQFYHSRFGDMESTLDAVRSGRLEVMITTYDTYRLTRGSVNMIEWDCIIADECHSIKERVAARTEAMNEINALCRIGLTGTAIQNKYSELWTLLNWTNPGRLGPLSAWNSVISKPLRIGQSHDATIPQLALARKTAQKLVHNLLPEFFLRRMKTLIADQLPKKTDRVVFCPLTPTQIEAYENFIDSPWIDAIRRSTEQCDCSSGKKRGWCCYATINVDGREIRWQNHVFPCMVTLQKLSNHLASLLPSGVDDKDKQARALQTAQTALPDTWKDLYRQRDSIVNFANQEFCGKWKILKKLLKFWHSEDDKVLVFSHSVRLLKMLQALFAHTTSYNVSFLDGSMSLQDRTKAVAAFNTDAKQFVFLISTKAGGVGLNIASANKVVVFDPNWNPAYDLQAQDRAYRIGQTRNVDVFRLVSSGTIEEIVYARQIYKQQQANIGYNASNERRYFRGVQGQADMKGEIFGLANLFSFQGENLVLRDIVNKTNVAESKAGVKVVGLDLGSQGDDDDEDSPLGNADSEDAAMSQLAALIAEGGNDEDSLASNKQQQQQQHKANAIQAILAGAGVEYTHENSEVVGSSKIETRLSKRAQETANETTMIDEHVFGASQSQSQNYEGQRPDTSDGLANGERFYKYKPPEAVRRRQFADMARAFGYDHVTEFALVVESWTQAQRRSCLDRYYKMCMPPADETLTMNIAEEDDLEL